MLKGLTRKVTLAAIVFLTLITLVAAFVLLLIAAVQTATSHLSDRVLPQIDAKGDFIAGMTHTLGEVETFTFSQDATDLTDAQEAVQEAQDALARLGALATADEQRDDPEERAANQRLVEHGAILLDGAQRLLADAPTSTAAQAEQTVAEIEQLHTDLAELEEESDTFLERHRTEVTEVLAASVQSVFVGAGALLVLCILLALLALFLLRRAIVQPVITLAEVAEDVASGQLDQTVPVGSGDEIGTLQRSFNTMVATLHQQTQQLQQQLATANAAQASAEAARAELAQQLQTIEEQRSVIREMSVPILPLSQTAFVMPLIGTLDTVRLQVAQQRALQAMEQTTTAYVVLDVTGVPLIDTQVGRGLLDIIQAARLLGTQVVLVGIRPEVAQTLVQLGIALDRVVVLGTLQDGISYVLGQGQALQQ